MKEDVKLSGIVEADETMIGGRRYGGKRGRGAKKEIVVGAVQRGGKLLMRHIPSAESVHISPHFSAIEPRSTLVTDEWRAYRRVAKKNNLKHEAIKHKEYMWTLGPWNTNTIEGQWSHVKKAIRGTYNAVSKRHLQKYLDERAFSFNHRGEDRFLLLLGCLRL